MCLFSQALGSLRLPFLEPPLCSAHQANIFLVELSFDTPGVVGNEHGFNIPIQFVEQDIAENGTHNRALRDTAERLIERMVGGEIALSTANSELCMTFSRHTAPQSMVIWY